MASLDDKAQISSDDDFAHLNLCGTGGTVVI